MGQRFRLGLRVRVRKFSRPSGTGFSPDFPSAKALGYYRLPLWGMNRSVSFTSSSNFNSRAHSEANDLGRMLIARAGRPAAFRA
jgi:hypothetical protein